MLPYHTIPINKLHLIPCHKYSVAHSLVWIKDMAFYHHCFNHFTSNPYFNK